jgi:hypothetical protein
MYARGQQDPPLIFPESSGCHDRQVHRRHRARVQRDGHLHVAVQRHVDALAPMPGLALGAVGTTQVAGMVIRRGHVSGTGGRRHRSKPATLTSRDQPKTAFTLVRGCFFS